MLVNYAHQTLLLEFFVSSHLCNITLDTGSSWISFLGCILKQVSTQEEMSELPPNPLPVPDHSEVSQDFQGNRSSSGKSIYVSLAQVLNCFACVLPTRPCGTALFIDLHGDKRLYV